MKTLFLLSCFSICLVAGCQKPKIQQFNLTLSFPDGTTENHTLTENKLLLVQDGDEHIILKARNGSKDTLLLQTVRYNMQTDSASGKKTIKRLDDSSISLTGGRKVKAHTGSGVAISYTTMMMIDTGEGPLGGCLGNCCSATCFTTSCCWDAFECRDVPCDCKAPDNCPKPMPAAHFFELFKNGSPLLEISN